MDKADKALEDIRDLQRSQRGSLKIRNAAILVLSKDGLQATSKRLTLHSKVT